MTIRFTLTVESDDDALFSDPFGETEKLLLKTLAAIKDERVAGFLHDTNGNRVGQWELYIPDTGHCGHPDCPICV